MLRKSKKPTKKKVDDPNLVLQKIIEGSFTSYKGIFKANIVRGIAFGLGSVLGATLLVGLLAWFLSFFDNMLIVGDIVDAIQRSINKQ